MSSNYGRHEKCSELQDRDRRLLNTLKGIVRRGNNAEVKSDGDGSWVVYEVKKKKEVVG